MGKKKALRLGRLFLFTAGVSISLRRRPKRNQLLPVKDKELANDNDDDQNEY